MLTIELLQASLPQQLKARATQELVDNFNTAVSDPLMAEAMRDNLISYTKVMADGRYKLPDYMEAIRYVSYKLMGYSNTDAYARTFPNRYNNLLANGTPSKDIAAYASMYNKTKLVNAIMEQTLIPTHILNQDIYQEAINKQAELMRNAKSEKVQMEAANSLLNHLKRPEATKVELDVNIKESSGITELNATMRQLAEQQVAMIQSGAVTARTVAHAPLVIENGE